MSGIENTIENGFADKNILIIGDLVADQFLRGSISRVSREAPVFILKHENTETLGGGAANAAVNVAGLGGKATIVGVVGNDSNGRDLVTALETNGVDTSGVIVNEGFQTTTKLRVLAGQQYARRQQVIRVDYENEAEISHELIDLVRQKSLAMLEDADAVIISDYGYGVAEKNAITEILKKSAELGIPTLVDSRQHTVSFKGATAATPNKEEVEHLLGEPYSEERCLALREELDFDALLVTLGNRGMHLVTRKQPSENIAIVGKDEPVDVTGAGDTVIAAFALGLACNLDYSVSARIANHAGGLVVMKKATASLSRSELLDSIRRYEPILFDESIGRAS
jgi:rfaE bifunctional protein kinase chain/domain